MVFSGKISLERVEEVAIITIENPPENTLTVQVLEALEQCISYLNEQKDIRAVILSGGAGQSFISGPNVEDFVTCSKEEFVRQITYGQKILRKLEKLLIPTIAAINGDALDGGFEVALCCDIRIASKTAAIGFPLGNRGKIPVYGGLSRLPLLIGEGNAKKVIYMAKRISADDAFRLGIMQEIVPHDQLMERALEIAVQISSVPPIVLQIAKDVITNNRDCNVITHPEKELSAAIKCYHTETPE